MGDEMESNVYFIDLRATFKENFLDKIGRLAKASGISETVKSRDLVGVKLHFGELGNTAFIRPVFIRKIVEVIKGLGGVPFLTDCNTVYAGTRSDTPSHLETAFKNGFAYSVVGAPIVIADGLRGRNETAVAIDQKRFKKVYIGSDIAEVDSLVSVAHFKGHELAGFGGSMKNIAMGCASRRGKLAQHSQLSPKVVGKKCIGCGECEHHCSQGAIALFEEKAVVNPELCIGCGECIIICPSSAVQIQWNQDIPVFLENMVEYAFGALKGKEKKVLFLNFITDVSPGCDCMPHNDAPIVRNIGVLASKDPVAIDQASVDLVNQEQGIPGSCLTSNTMPGEDKFKGVYPYIDWPLQLDYAQHLGMGSRKYNLVSI
jgi:uncharacterized Fe-S center protein